MLKSNLSPLEQKVYFFVQRAQGGVASFDTLKSLRLMDESTLKLVVHQLCKKGWFLRLKKGTYLVQPPFSSFSLPDSFLIAPLLFPGYLGFSSALYVHRLSDEVPFTVFVVTRHVSKTKRLGEYEFKAVALGKRAVGQTTVGYYTAASLEKTLFDCFYKPEFAGGHAAVLKAVYNAPSVDWKAFLSYVDRFASDALCQKIGYLLSLLDQTNKPVPRFILKALKKKVKSPVRLVSGLNGVFVPEWKIVDPFGKKLLAWWYHG